MTWRRLFCTRSLMLNCESEIHHFVIYTIKCFSLMTRYFVLKCSLFLLPFSYIALSHLSNKETESWFCNLVGVDRYIPHSLLKKYICLCYLNYDRFTSWLTFRLLHTMWTGFQTSWRREVSGAGEMFNKITRQFLKATHR